MKKVPDPAGQKSPDPDPHPCISQQGKMAIELCNQKNYCTMYLINYNKSNEYSSRAKKGEESTVNSFDDKNGQ